MSKLTKCTKDKSLFGVCCGISKATGIDVTIIRLALVLGALFTGSILFWVYIIAALVLPNDEQS